MFESLTDSIKSLTETIINNQDAIIRKLSGGKIDHVNGSMQEFFCPVCGLKTELYNKMESGYCKYCCSRISYKAAKSKELSQELIDNLSGDEYYAIMYKEGQFDRDLAKYAAKKGSALASLQLGVDYYDDEDYIEAKKYFEIAANAGNINGEFGIWCCEVSNYTYSSNISSGQLEEYLRRFSKFDLSQITLYEKSKVVDFIKRLNELLGETRQEEERAKRPHVFVSDVMRRMNDYNFDARSYVDANCKDTWMGLSTDADKERINSDPNLSFEQKEQALQELEHQAWMNY